jgi:protein arginine kinase activator
MAREGAEQADEMDVALCGQHCIAGIAAMKCQKCPNAAKLHITEVLTEDHIEELHLCEICAHKYLAEPQTKQVAKAIPSAAVSEGDEPAGMQRECDMCGIKFVDFRNLGRLGCPHDYDVFREDLLQLLENIHGETRHVGKVPRRLPQNRQSQNELMALRKQLQAAVNREAYEEAARLRDRIRQLEES